jgi:hypothetical protein
LVSKNFEKKKKEEYLYDLSTTFTINLEIINSYLNTNSERKIITTKDSIKKDKEKKFIEKKLDLIKKKFEEKKNLHEKCLELNGKILMTKQIYYENKRRYIENEDYYKDQLNEFVDLNEKKFSSIKQIEKKYEEVEIFVRKESQLLEYNESFRKFKNFRIVNFLDENEDFENFKILQKKDIDLHKKELLIIMNENKEINDICNKKKHFNNINKKNKNINYFKYDYTGFNSDFYNININKNLDEYSKRIKFMERYIKNMRCNFRRFFKRIFLSLNKNENNNVNMSKRAIRDKNNKEKNCIIKIEDNINDKNKGNLNSNISLNIDNNLNFSYTHSKNNKRIINKKFLDDNKKYTYDEFIFSNNNESPKFIFEENSKDNNNILKIKIETKENKITKEKLYKNPNKNDKKKIILFNSVSCKKGLNKNSKKEIKVNLDLIQNQLEEIVSPKNTKKIMEENSVFMESAFEMIPKSNKSITKIKEKYSSRNLLNILSNKKNFGNKDEISKKLKSKNSVIFQKLQEINKLKETENQELLSLIKNKSKNKNENEDETKIININLETNKNKKSKFEFLQENFSFSPIKLNTIKKFNKSSEKINIIINSFKDNIFFNNNVNFNERFYYHTDSSNENELIDLLNKKNDNNEFFCSKRCLLKNEIDFLYENQSKSIENKICLSKKSKGTNSLSYIESYSINHSPNSINHSPNSINHSLNSNINSPLLTLQTPNVNDFDRRFIGNFGDFNLEKLDLSNIGSLSNDP